MNTIIGSLVKVVPQPILTKKRRKMLLEQGATTWVGEGSHFIGVKGKVEVRISELADMRVDEFVSLLISVNDLS
jgi:hypothetical protein